MPKSMIFRSVQSKGFEELRPIYDQCSMVFQAILKDETLRKKMEKVPLEEVGEDGKKKKRLMGDLFHDFGCILGNPLSGKVCNSAWYMRIIIFNLVSLLRSRADQVKIYELLQKYQFKICPSLRKELAENELYPSNTNLKNLCQAKEMPHLPESAVFRLDYAYSDKQMCVFDCEKLEFSVQIRTSKEAQKTGLPEWKTFNLILPSFIREQAAGKITKPLFYTDKAGKLICQIPYEVKPEKHPEFKNVLGVDLGKVKPYSAVVLYRDKTYSNEMTPSKELMNLYEKLARINENIDRNYQKYKRAKAYQKKDEEDTRRQQARWFNYQSAREKRTRLKEEAEWLMAEEIVEIARRNQCKEIHMENLTWVNNRGGKWDFSLIRDRVMQVAELHGIEVVFINPCNTSSRHPLTHELGKESGRSIVFKDGTRVDRDQLAALNIALTKKEKKEGEKTKTKIQKTELKPVSSTRLVRKEKRRESSRNRKKKQYDFKNKKRMHQIAAFCRKPEGKAFQDLSALTVQRKACFLEGYDGSNLLPKGFLKYNKLQFAPSYTKKVHVFRAMQLETLVLQKKNMDFDALPASDQQLTFQTLENELISKLQLEKPGTDTFKSLGLLKPGCGYTIAAQLLSDRNEFPGVELVRYGMNENEIQNRLTVENCSVLTMYKEAEKFFNLYFRSELINGSAREEYYRIPKNAFREAVLNALIHRDWKRRNSRILIRMYNDSIKISSPGGLPEGITPEEYLQDDLSVPRNPDLAYVFLRLGYIERLGSGIRRILSSYQDQTGKPEFAFSKNVITVRLPSLSYQANLSKDQNTLFAAIKENQPISRKEIEKQTGFGRSKTAKLLKELTDLNLIEKVGNGPSIRYTLNLHPALIH